MKITTAIFIVAGTIITALAALLILQKNALDKVETEVTELRVANLTLTKSVAQLTQQRKVDDRIVTEFTQGLADLRARAETQTKLLFELERQDPDVKTFLDLALPLSLSDLLAGSADEGSAGNAAR